MPSVKTFIKSFERDLKQNIARADKSEIEAEIIETILRGKSPVEGKKFEQYSEKYADRFKGGDRKPVTMNQIGKMLDSLKISQLRGKVGISIEFLSKIAAFHDILGAGKSKVIRRLLPRSNERFKSNIRKVIEKFFKRNIRKTTR